FLDQMGAGTAYNMAMALRLKGRLDVDRLEQTLQAVVDRHQTLRTTFRVVDGQPVQRIAESLDLSLQRLDLRELGREGREPEIIRLAQEEAERPFDLAVGPLLRRTLLTLGDVEHVLLLTMHHIVSDGWSMGVLDGELTTLYEAFCEGGDSPLAELPIQYGDFTLWQRSWLKGEALEQQISYWRAQLAELPPLDLPTDRRRPAVQTFRASAYGFEVPGELTEAIQRLSGQEGLTLAMVLLAAWQVLLSRTSGQQEVAVGSPIANRTQRELEPLIGFF
ncbi:MAG: non-ribosomal peptide synthetase, partial [bacterium]|nr:non-ribosomal peptide synthetase [bacterium]